MSEIGKVVYVASDVESNELWRRVALTALFAWVVFGLCYLAGMHITNSLPAAATGGTVAALGLAALLWRNVSRTWGGRTVYVGAEGITTIEANGTKRSILYRDDFTTTADTTHVFIDGRCHTTESVTFWYADGRAAMHLSGTYVGAPSAHALAVRAAIRAAGSKRARWAAWRIAHGEAVAFPLLAHHGSPATTGEALVIDAHTLAYYKSPTNWPMRIDRSRARLTVRDSYLEVRIRDTGAVLGSFERSKVSNYDVLQQLVA